MRQRLHLALLLPAAVAAGHALAYLIAHPHGAGHHGADSMHAYLAPAAALATPLLLVALRPSAWRRGPPRFLTLWSAQVCLFLGQEILERSLTHSMHDFVLEPVIWFGIAAQALTAFILHRYIKRATGAVRAPTVAPAVRETPSFASPICPAPLRASSLLLWAAALARGPPQTLLARI